MKPPFHKLGVAISGLDNYRTDDGWKIKMLKVRAVGSITDDGPLKTGYQPQQSTWSAQQNIKIEDWPQRN